jgi:hypothetical protein
MAYGTWMAQLKSRLSGIETTRVFPSEENAFDSSIALLSLRSRNPARSLLNGFLLHRASPSAKSRQRADFQEPVPSQEKRRGI